MTLSKTTAGGEEATVDSVFSSRYGQTSLPKYELMSKAILCVIDYFIAIYVAFLFIMFVIFQLGAAELGRLSYGCFGSNRS